MILVSVVIPVLNQWTLTERCLQTLAEHSPESVEVIVVDNASTDATPHRCPSLGKELFGERFHYLQQTRNLNFGPACNLGARQAKGPLLFFLNNDTEIQGPWAEELSEFLLRRNLGAAGPTLLYPNKSIQHIGIIFTPQLNPRHFLAYFPADRVHALQPRTFQSLTGAALLVPKALFAELDGFFPEFKNGCEDMDLCARIRATGRQLAVCPEISIIHHTSQTEGRFDHDRHNTALLNSRQSHMFVPDYHAFMAECGYAIHFTPWLNIYASLDERKNSQQTKELRNASFAEIANTLVNEPLWQGGYALARPKAERHEQLLHLTLQECRFLPSMRAFMQLEQLAQDGDPLHQFAQENLEHIRARQAQPRPLYAKARKMLAHARTTRDITLTSALEEWLDQIR